MVDSKYLFMPVGLLGTQKQKKESVDVGELSAHRTAFVLDVDRNALHFVDPSCPDRAQEADRYAWYTPDSVVRSNRMLRDVLSLVFGPATSIIIPETRGPQTLYRSPMIKDTCQWWTLYIMDKIVQGSTQDSAMTDLKARIRDISSSANTEKMFARRILEEFVKGLNNRLAREIQEYDRKFREPMRHAPQRAPQGGDRNHVCITGRMPELTTEESKYA